MPHSKNALIDLIRLHTLPEIQLHSRVHKLNSLPSNIFIKRDDELSSGITGSKMRKYASLIQFLIGSDFEEIAIIGSAQSNNVISLLQLLNENGINAKLFLLEANENDLKGNLLWLHLLHNTKNISWIRREEWKNVNSITEEYARTGNKKIFVLYEGAANVYSLPGAMTLFTDIQRNETENELKFNHIFIDSGSGTTAIGFLLALALAEIKDINIHITLIAGTEADFKAQYQNLSQDFFSIYNMPEKCFEGNLYFSRSLLAPSFGSITQSVLTELHEIAKTEGVLMEPVYSVKHFFTAKKIIQNKGLEGNILIVNSGGSLGISGFQAKLAGLFH